ncbi:MAG: hypothetical protein ACRDPC_13735 [Solirubrobacteraceae bacterium]
MVDLLDPDPATIVVDDIAHALAMLCRFAGSVCRFWSVADHALLCRELVCEAGEPELALAALHHDSHEALIGDITTPVAQLLDRGALCQVRRRLDEAIGTALGIDPDLFAHPVVVEADRAAVHLEARALQQSRGRALLTPPPLRRVAARSVISDGPRLAKRRFLAAHRRHTKASLCAPGQPRLGHTIP